MKILNADYSKRGQMKIQQMAFVLVALMIFFVIVTLFYFSVKVRSLEQSATTLRADEARELSKKIASSPELSWSGECDNCIDMDKAMMLQDRKSYEGFWGVDYLAIEKIYPSNGADCTLANYPDCGKITIVKGEIGTPANAFVSLCRWEGSEKYEKCEIGRVYVRGESING